MSISSGSSLSESEIPDDVVTERKLETLDCICLSPADVVDIGKVFEKLIESPAQPFLVPCITSTVQNCYNLLLKVENNELTKHRIYFADLFYRFRHEILSKYLMYALSLPSTRTDKPFSDFGVDSNRTPDFIIEKGDVHYILEVTASSSEEKSFQLKGLEQAGFEAKYEKEIKEMRVKGMKVEYFVVFFNMQSPDHSNFDDVIKSLSEVFTVDPLHVNGLSLLCKYMARLTSEMKRYLVPASSILFSSQLIIPSQHNNLSFLYNKEEFLVKHDYKDFYISIPVYQKISTLWSRLISIKERQISDGENFQPVLDLSNNRIYFQQINKGMTTNELMEIIAKSDKQAFFEKLYLNVGGRIDKATTAEGGVRFTRRVDRNVKDLEFKEIPLEVSHERKIISEGGEIDDKYSIMSNYHFGNSFSPKYYDEQYEDRLIKSMQAFDEDCTENMDPLTFKLPVNAPITIASYRTENIDMDSVAEGLMKRLKEENSFEDSLPIKQMKMKSSFILPVVSLNKDDRCPISEKNIDFMNALLKLNLGDYTRVILSKASSIDYKFHDSTNIPSTSLNGYYQQRFNISNEITRLVKNKMKECKTATFHESMLDVEAIQTFKALKKEISGINKVITDMEKTEGVKKNIGMIRVNSKGKSPLSMAFRREMAHFKDRNTQSTVEGIGLGGDPGLMLLSLESEFNNLMETFTLHCGENNDFLIDQNVHDDVKLLKDLKTHAIDSHKNLINQVKDSFLGHSSAFISRYAHSLMFYSQLPFNNSYIRVDNLGYKNVLLLVRGGSKIFKTKGSKLHRLIFPVNSSTACHYVDSKFGESSFKHFFIGPNEYVITPWIILNENVLADSISFYPRVVSFCVLNLDPSLSFAAQIYKVFVNILLAFHNRRHTESMLANLRYILLSTMGDYSAFTEILPEFIGFNHDKLQAYLRLQIINNYPRYYKSMVKIQKRKNFIQSDLSKSGLSNIITGYGIESVDELALMIYSTFLMTKAPYQRSVERANNLKGILEIHQLFNDKVGLGLNGEEQLKKITVVNEGDYLDYAKQLMENDFKLDPYYCTNIGIFADSYFQNNVGASDLISEWIKIMTKNWDSMATTTGLRGFKDKDFFGRKGFFVIYDYILNNLDYKNKIREIFDTTLTDDEKRKMIRNLNLTYAQEVGKVPETLVYHAVDKRQWRGGREIYVMDLETKRMQQPIEKFMAFLCKKTDTELISIPSDKRSQVIHHTLFEKDIADKDIKTWFLTLDCSKWAPKSMFVKFALMILPMGSIPKSFKNHFLNYLDLLYNKRLYFNKQECSVLSKNPKHSSLTDAYLVSDDSVNGLYMLQPYSWVMGIFNYTSSLMHAFNQKYCSYLLKESTLRSFNEDCSLHMFAHSDDSGGRLNVSSEQMLVRCLFYYEINLKACNHLLSRKKCVVSRIYFEILSIIYMFSQLLALLPKFLGGIRFLPTDKGPAHDMLQSYSKSIEVIVAGADFSTAYLYQKFYSAEIWRFYYNRTPSILDYSRPVQFLGMPDAHPLMVLLTGSDSDIVRLIVTGKMNLIIGLIKLNRYFDNFESEEGLIKSLKFQVKIRGVKSSFKEAFDSLSGILNSWSLANVNFKNTPFNALAFLRKLNDPGFTGSLVNETETRRLSRAYYFRSGESVQTKLGNKKLCDIMEVITEIQLLIHEGAEADIFKKYFGESSLQEFLTEISLDNPDNQFYVTYFKDIYSNPIKLCQYLDRLDLKMDNIKSVKRTLKPTHIQIVKFGRGFSNNFDPTQLISYIYEPEIRWALPNPNNLNEASQDLESLLRHMNIEMGQIDPGTALKIVRTHQNKSIKDIYLYSCIPGHLRIIKNFASILTFLSTNSILGSEIQGLSLKLRANLTRTDNVYLDIDEEAYTINTYLDVLCTVGSHIKLNKISLLPFDTVKFPGGGVEELIEVLKNRKFVDDNFAYYSHYVSFLELKHVLWYGQPQGAIFKEGAYYTYLKEQKFRGVWYGKGEIAYYYQGNWVIVEIYNNRAVRATGNILGKVDRRFLAFITDTLQSNGIDPCLNDPIEKAVTLKERTFIGYDISGEVSVDSIMNMRGGLSYTYQAHDPNFIDEISAAEVQHVKENLFTYKNSSGYTKKIQAIRIEKGEVIPILKSLIEPSSLETYLLQNGYEDYADFISQSVLTNYGAEYYVSLNSFKEDYLGSAMHEAMLHTQTHNNNLMPNKIQPATLPAPEGSLLRILINYQEETGKEILKMPKSINPSILSIRNEYPESFSVILSEKMNQSFDSIYDDSEQLLLYSEFVTAASHNDIDKIRSSCVKLMCYWGYSSLVNVLQTYTFSKGVKNHSVFNLEFAKKNNNYIYKELFQKLILAIINSMKSCFNPDNRIEYLNNVLVEKDLDALHIRYCLDTTYNTYNYKHPIINPTLSSLTLLNMLQGMMRDPKFVNNLNKELSDIYPLNTLLIEPRTYNEFVATINTLRLIWINSNKGKEVHLDAIRPYQHLPHDVINPLSLIKSLTAANVKPGRIKYHYFMSDNAIHELRRPSLTMMVDDRRYIIEQELLEDLSDVSVAHSDFFTFDGVLSQDFLESDNYSDISYELISMDPDMELIQDSLMDEEEMYEKTEIKKRGRSLVVPVKWVLLPYLEGDIDVTSRINNTAENIVILSCSYIRKFKNIRNSLVYVVNYSRFPGELDRMIAHVVSSKHLKRSFWDKYIGGIELNNLEDLMINLKATSIRTTNKIGDIGDMGLKISNMEEFEKGGNVVTEELKSNPLDNWIKLGFSEEESRRYYKEREEIKVILNDIESSIDNYYNSGIIDRTKAEHMKAKYKNAALSKLPGVSTNIIKSFFTESELININHGVLSGEITSELTSLDHIKMMQAPESFGAARVHSKPDSKAFKDIRYKAELDCLYEGLSDLVSSSTLSMSTRMFKVVKSLYNSWRYAAENTKYKRETKQFFLNLYLSLMNTASCHNSSKHDNVWQELNNTFAVILGEEPDEVEQKSLSYRLQPSRGLRMKYKVMGFE